MIINGLGTFELTGPINECETLLRLLRLRTFSYKPYMMVTYEGWRKYRFYTYDEDDPARIVLSADVTLEEGEERHIEKNAWFKAPPYIAPPLTGPWARW